MPPCRLCHRDYATLTRTGLCRSCNLRRAQRGELEPELQARLDAVVEAAKDKPAPARARVHRRQRKVNDGKM